MKISILALFIVLSTIALQAQYRPAPEISAKEKVRALSQTLTLTPEQSIKVTQIYLDHFRYRDSMITVINTRYSNQKARFSAFNSTFNKQELDTDKKISSLLDSEQKVRYEKYISSRGTGYMISEQSPSPRK